MKEKKQIGRIDYPNPLARKQYFKEDNCPPYIEKDSCKVHEKTMVKIDRIIKLRDQMRKAIEIQKEDEGRHQEGTPAHSYHLGGLHRLEEFESKLNDLIILG